MIPLYTLSIEKKVFCEFTKRFYPTSRPSIVATFAKESRERFFSNFNILERATLVWHRIASFVPKKDLISWNAVRIVSSFDVFPISHIYAESPCSKTDFSFDFRGSTRSTHTSPSCLSLEMCILLRIWSKRRGSTNKYKAIKLVFWNEIVIGSSFEK